MKNLKNKRIGLFLLAILIAAVPLTVYISRQQQELRQRASQTSQTDLNFVDGATCAGSPPDVWTVGMQKSLSVCLDTKGLPINAYDVMVILGTENFGTITLIQPQRPEMVSLVPAGQEVSAEGAVHIAKAAMNTTQTLSGVLQLGTITFTLTRAADGTIGLSKNYISSPNNAQDLLTTDNPTYSYAIQNAPAPRYSITGYLFDDANENNSYDDTNNANVSNGKTIELHDQQVSANQPTLVTTTTTRTDEANAGGAGAGRPGYFQIDNVSPGIYTLRAPDITGYRYRGEQSTRVEITNSIQSASFSLVNSAPTPTPTPTPAAVIPLGKPTVSQSTSCVNNVHPLTVSWTGSRGTFTWDPTIQFYVDFLAPESSAQNRWHTKGVAANSTDTSGNWVLKIGNLDQGSPVPLSLTPGTQYRFRVYNGRETSPASDPITAESC